MSEAKVAAVRPQERAVLRVLNAGGVVTSETGAWSVKLDGERVTVPDDLVRRLMRAGWIAATRNAGGYTGRAFITGRGARALRLSS